jgi:hypothetical protein
VGRSHLPDIRPDSLYILVFYLAGFDDEGCLSNLIYFHIKSYFPAQSGARIKRNAIKIDFGSAASREKLNKAVQAAGQEMPKRVLFSSAPVRLLS